MNKIKKLTANQLFKWQQLGSNGYSKDLWHSSILNVVIEVHSYSSNHWKTVLVHIIELSESEFGLDSFRLTKMCACTHKLGLY